MHNEIKTNFVCPWQAGNFDPEKPYNVCATCVFREDEICDGPNYAFLTGARRCELLQTRLAHLKQKEPGKWTYKYIADCTFVSEPTVIKIISDPEYDPRVSTFTTVIHFVMGGSRGKFPCAMMALVQTESEAIEVESTALLEKLAEKESLVSTLHAQADHLRSQLEFQRDQIKTKDGYITEFWALVKELQAQLRHARGDKT